MSENQGKKLQQALDKARKTQGDLAEFLGINIRTVNRWVNEDREIKEKYHSAIAEFLDARAAQLFGGVDGVEEVNVDVGPGEYMRRIVPIYNEAGDVEYYIRATYVGLTKAEGEEEMQR